MVDHYNNHMGGVDMGDQLLSYYGFNHRTVKWYRRVAFYMLDMAIVNAYILYKMSTQDKKHVSHMHFRIEVAKGLLERAGDDITSLALQHCNEPFARLHERHFLEKIPNTNSRQLDCHVCSGKKGNGRKTTTFRCKQCGTPLCAIPCFELYHTYKDPVRYL